MQRHEMLRNTPPPQLFEQRRREMQACRGRSHRTVFGRINRLIALAIARVGRSFQRDVRRQRHRADRVDGAVEVGPCQ